MAKNLKKTDATQQVSISAGCKAYGDNFDFLPELRGSKKIKTYRQMSENDAIIGAVLSAMDMMLRGVSWRVDPADDTPQAEEKVEFVESVFTDMSHTWEDFISNVLTFLVYGYSFFEVVYKIRGGVDQTDPAKKSKFSDNLIGIRKLKPIYQGSVARFIFDEDGGIAAIEQNAFADSVIIPIQKGLLFRTQNNNNNPYGRSILRNAYKSWYYLTRIQNIEAIAIERELNGLPLGRIPSEYFEGNNQTKAEFESILRDVKNNEQGFILLPSDRYVNDDGKVTNNYMMEFELVSSSGSRAIDTRPVITGYQQDIARSVLADFLTLGSSERGSFALSKSKTDLFLKSLEGYLQNISSTINRYLLPVLWQLNGFSYDLMPSVAYNNIAPPDLDELGKYIRDLSSSGIMLSGEQTENILRDAAGLPEVEVDPDMMGRPDGE